MRHIEPVKITEEPTPGGNTRQIHEHPAFGSIRISRRSGYQALFNSDFRHHHYISITISRAKLIRDLSSDTILTGGRDELIEVNLSEAQFATAITSMNMGCGSPCTISHIERKLSPEIGEPPSRREQFSAELMGRLDRAKSLIATAAAGIQASGLSKKKADELLSPLNQAIMDLGSNLNFVADQFDEHMEKTVEDARAEIAGTAMAAMNALAMGALQNAGSLPLTAEQAAPRLLIDNGGV